MFENILRLSFVEISQKKIQDKVLLLCQKLCRQTEPSLIALQTPTTHLPSYLFLQKSICEYLPDSLKETNTHKLKKLFVLMSFVLKE